MGKKPQPPIEELFQESYRQLLHIAVALFIIPLRWFGFRYAIGFAIAAFLWNLLVMPRWFKGSFRPSEKQKGYSTGMLVYPISILVMAVLFPLPIMAAGWAVLSVSDGSATLFGKLFGKRHLPWKKNKTWIGSFSFFISATFFGWIALLWTGNNMEFSSSFAWKFFHSLESAIPIFSRNECYPIDYFMNVFLDDTWLILFCSCIAGFGAAIIESLPFPKFNDNLFVPIFYCLFCMFIIRLVSLFTLIDVVAGTGP